MDDMIQNVSQNGEEGDNSIIEEDHSIIEERIPQTQSQKTNHLFQKNHQGLLNFNDQVQNHHFINLIKRYSQMIKNQHQLTEEQNNEIQNIIVMVKNTMFKTIFTDDIEQINFQIQRYIFLIRHLQSPEIVNFLKQTYQILIMKQSFQQLKISQRQATSMIGNLKEKLQQSNQMIENKMEEFKKIREQLQNAQEKAEEDYQQRSKRYETEIQIKSKQYQQNLQEKERQYESNLERIQIQHESEIKKINDKLMQSQGAVRQVQQKYFQTQRDVAYELQNQEKIIDNSKKQIERLVQENNRLFQKVKELNDIVYSNSLQLQQMQQKIRQNPVYKQLSNQYQETSKKNQQISKKNQQISRMYQTLQDQFHRLDEEFDDLKEEKKQIQISERNQKKRNLILQKEIQSQKQKYNHLKQNITAEVEKLKDQLAKKTQINLRKEYSAQIQKIKDEKLKNEKKLQEIEKNLKITERKLIKEHQLSSKRKQQLNLKVISQNWERNVYSSMMKNKNAEVQNLKNQLKSNRNLLNKSLVQRRFDYDEIYRLKNKNKLIQSQNSYFKDFVEEQRQKFKNQISQQNKINFANQQTIIILVNLLGVIKKKNQDLQSTIDDLNLKIRQQKQQNQRIRLQNKKSIDLYKGQLNEFKRNVLEIYQKNNKEKQLFDESLKQLQKKFQGEMFFFNKKYKKQLIKKSQQLQQTVDKLGKKTERNKYLNFKNQGKIYRYARIKNKESKQEFERVKQEFKSKQKIMDDEITNLKNDFNNIQILFNPYKKTKYDRDLFQ